MAFNPLSGLIVTSLSDYIQPNATVLEFGNQTFQVTDEVLEIIANRLDGNLAVDRAALSALKGPNKEHNDKTTEKFYRALGFSDYRSIDVNDKFGSLVMDLNMDLQSTYNYHETFSLITNCGTGEHIFDQATVFRNMHNLTRKNGFMIHIMPFAGRMYVNHGFFRFEPGLYFDLAQANHYGMLTIGISDRWGYGVESETLLGESTEEKKTFNILLSSHRINKKSFAKIPDWRYGTMKYFIKRAKDKLRFVGREQNQHKSQRLELTKALYKLSKRSPGLLVFAVLQKYENTPFRLPFQTKYTDAIQDAEIRMDYAEQKISR